jgi:uroporphyrinogen decarboxylase
MNNIFLDTINGKSSSRPPVWFMRQAGRILPSYRKLKESHNFYDMMKDPELSSEVTLLPINDLGVDSAILFSDILVIPDALGLDLIFTKNGPKFTNALNNENFNHLNFDPQKLEYIYTNIKKTVENKNTTPLIGFCGGPLTTFMFMFRGDETQKSFKDAIKFFYNNRKESMKIIEQITEASIVYVENQIKSGIQCFQLFETYCGSIAYDLYKECILPYSKKILNSAKELGCPTIFFPKDFSLGLKYINKDICDFVSIDWTMKLEDARNLVDKNVGLQGNMDPRIFYYDELKIESYLESLSSFGKNNHDWIFNLGHGFLPDIDYKKVQNVVNWIKNKNWNR